MIRGLLAIGAALCLTGAACGSRNGSETAASGGRPRSSATVSAEDISFGESLAQIRGHHRASIELYRRGDAGGALIHASHPIEELLAAVQGELSQHGSEASGPLDQTLEDSTRAITDGVPPNELQAIYDEAGRLMDEAESDVLGDVAGTATYRASVVASLLITAGHEYEEALGNDKIRLLAEYQDGYAFIREAHRLYDAVAGEVESASADEADEIQGAFEVLEKSLPSVRPPASIAPLDDVEVAAELIGRELEATVGARLATAVSPEEVEDEIKELLAGVVRAYRAGNPDEAAELSAEAYLENYEVIEADVIEHAPEVNSQLEPLLGAELRRKIQDGAAVSEIEAMVGEARRLLARALEALAGAAEEHP